MLKLEQILEGIVEALKAKRRYGPNFPTVWDLSHLTWDTDNNKIELDLLDNGIMRKFDLYVEEVRERDDKSDPANLEELANESKD